MTAQTVVLLLFLSLMKDVCCKTYFQLEDLQLNAVEGSCVELRCSVISPITPGATNAHWFWIKDAKYKESDYEGTIIYSSDTKKKPVSPDYKDRVTYTGSPSTSWQNIQKKPTCNVRICNLNKSDSGDYAFRYNGTFKWMTDPRATLNVNDNPCPITFEKPPVVNESDTISLKCSTLSSCSLDLQIKVSGKQPLSQSSQNEEKQKSIISSFKVNRQDDKKEASCQTRGNKDAYLIQKNNLNVQYAPRDVSAVVSPKWMIKEKQSVTLTCTANGNPAPTFTWFVNEERKSIGKELKFDSITDSQSGQYTCEAGNILGNLKSSSVSIDVKYPPEVKVTTSSSNEVTEGNKLTLNCTVIRSKPQPVTFLWFKGNIKTRFSGQTFVIESVTPEDKGSYSCRATNSAGTGPSAGLEFRVRYRPRRTGISPPDHDRKVKVGESLTLTCSADAHPPPSRFSWHRYNTVEDKQIDLLQWDPFAEGNLRLDAVKRTDEACYVCNATNMIGTGENSEPVCLKVLYPPTTPRLSMDNLVNEGQPTTIHCTVESFPPSQLTLTKTSSSKSSKVVLIHRNTHWYPNALNYRFNATSTDSGFYTCEATNSFGSERSVKKELVVKYRPKDVTVKYQPTVVNENTPLKLSCSALSYPPEKTFTWTKTRDGKTESMWSIQNVTLKSVSPSDSGLYSCTAWNKMGSGKSTPVAIKVRYAPKLIQIIRGAEQQLPDGRSSVTLSCVSDGYPEVTEFSWYKKTQKKHEEVSKRKTHTVYSDQPGEYYCGGKNEISGKLSEPIQMFDRTFVKILLISFLLMFFLVVLLIGVYRHRRKKPIQQGNRNRNRSSSFVFLGWWNGISRRNEPTMAEPFRSRDDLITDQPHRPNGQRRQQPRSDNTPASSTNAVYYTVNLPARQQGPSGEMPVKQKAQHTQDESLNYASIQFKTKEKQKKKQAEADTVYAVVNKNKTPKKTEQENLDYENLKTAHAAKSPNPMSYDSDTSEDEGELNYSKVKFMLKPGHERADSSSTSSTSSEEETQYSQVKI